MLETGKRVLKCMLCMVLALVVALSPVSIKAADETAQGTPITIYFDNSYTKWDKVMVHYWGKETTTWPGKELVKKEGSETDYQIALPEGTTGLVFNDGGNGQQSTDVTDLENNASYGTVAEEGGKFVVLKKDANGNLPKEPDENNVTDEQKQPKQVNVHVGTTSSEVNISFTTLGKTASEVLVKNKKDGTETKATGTNRFSYIAQKYLHTVKVTGLTASTEYEYTIGTGAYAYKGTFKTTPKKGSEDAFSFAYIADSQVSNEENAKAAGATFAQLNGCKDLAFTYLAGDVTDNATAEKQWEQLFDNGGKYPSAGQQFFGNHLLAVTQGNHDISTLSGHISTPNEQGDAVYSFEYGPAKFIILNLETAKSDETKREQQKKFLEEKVKEAKAAGQWTIVGFHKSIYTGASHIVDSDVMAARKYWGPVLAGLDVDMVLQGHDHVYARGFVEADGKKAEPEKDSKGAYMHKENAPLYMVGGHAGGLKWYAQKDYTVTEGDPLLPNYEFLDVNSTVDKSNEKKEQVYTVFEVSKQSISSKTYMMKYDTDKDEITTSPYVYDSFTLKRKREVKALAFTASKKVLVKGDRYQAKVKVTPEDATNKKIKYSSSNPKVATIDANGKVVAKITGTTTLKAVSVSNSKVIAALKVKVVLPVKQPTEWKVVRANEKDVLLQWNKAKEAAKYEVYRATKKTGTYKKITTVTSAKKQITYQDKTAKAGKKYYYKVRGYKMVDGVKISGTFTKVVYAVVK